MKVARRVFLKQSLGALAAPLLSCAAAPAPPPLYNRRIRLFYRPEMVLDKDVAANYSKSPQKPRLWVQFLQKKNLLEHFEQVSDWTPFEPEDFLVAHTPKYVNDFFAGAEPLASSNGLAWSAQFADSVRYTNASLYHALAAAVQEPATVAFSPSSGFHHAMPRRGSGFCTFSGQVIASVKIYRQHGLSGAHIDLDGHYGNAIYDARSFVKDLDLAVPPGCNVNPEGRHGVYLKNLRLQLGRVRELFLQGKLHYVFYAHGADSHEWDDLGGQCSTEEWLEAARLVYAWVDDLGTSARAPRAARPRPVWRLSQGRLRLGAQPAHGQCRLVPVDAMRPSAPLPGGSESTEAQGRLAQRRTLAQKLHAKIFWRQGAPDEHIDLSVGASSPLSCEPHRARHAPA